MTFSQLKSGQLYRYANSDYVWKKEGVWEKRPWSGGPFRVVNPARLVLPVTRPNRRDRREMNRLRRELERLESQPESEGRDYALAHIGAQLCAWEEFYGVERSLEE